MNVGPINPSKLDHAARVVRRALEGASRGDEKSVRDLVRFAEAESLETTLVRVAGFADACAPSLDELKINRGQYSADAVRLRFELETVTNVLNAAAGRATVTDLAQVRADAGAVVERAGADESHDSGEFPRAPSPAGDAA